MREGDGFRAIPRQVELEWELLAHAAPDSWWATSIRRKEREDTMSRTNLNAAATPAPRRASLRRVIVLSAVLVPTVAAGAVWFSGSARPAAAPQVAQPVAAAPATLAPASPAPSAPATVSRTMTGKYRQAPRSAVTTPTATADQMPGAVGIAVPEELQTFMVARRLPDGRIVLEHATAPKAAPAKARASASKGRKTAAKAEPEDR
jgi:hypothetical protein